MANEKKTKKKRLYGWLFIPAFVGLLGWCATSGDDKPKTTSTITTAPVYAASFAESKEQRAERERLNLVSQYPMLPNGNTTQRHTIVGEPFQENNDIAFDVSVDGTNPDGLIHNLNSAIRLGPGKTTEIVVRALNPLMCIDHNAWGECTPIWGERYGRPLLDKERIEFFSERDGERYVDQFGTLFLVLIDPHTGQRIPGKEKETWAGFNPNQREIKLRYTNSTTSPVEYDIGLHRNLFCASFSITNPNETTSMYGASGWRGGQYWKLRITIRSIQ